MTSKISQLRSIAHFRQAGRCYYCNLPMWTDNPQRFAAKYQITLKQAKPFQCTAEHLQARQDGGSNTQPNIVAACLHCNQKRHKRKIPPSPDDYKTFIDKRIKAQRWHQPWVFQRGLYEEH